MALYAQDQLSDDEVTQIIARHKLLVGDLEWAEKPNNTAFIEFAASLSDETGATIPGLTIDVRIRLGLYDNDCKFDFTLFQFKSGRKLRAYQINVVPWEKSSHTDYSTGEVWYGPHQHFGAKTVRFEPEVQLGCSDHEKWFNLFLDRAKVKFGGKYFPPMQPRLI